jgi:hypothetical protein
MADLRRIGVLGCGYLGKHLLSRRQWSADSWYSVHKNVPDLPYIAVQFSWVAHATWPALPHEADWLILTIPPVHDNCEQEKQLLVEWCEWMAVNRPHLKRLIYISTTGVYGSDEGVWTPQSECRPDGVRGQLRLDCESILSQYFQCTAIRAGGIYGPGSNLIEKIYAGMPVYGGNKPVYRIHVEDLVGIIEAIMNCPSPGAAHNAVDDKAASQDEVIEWLCQQAAFKAGFDGPITFNPKRLDADGGAKRRVVSNQSLTDVLDYHLIYPTFKHGLSGIEVT